MSTTPKTIKTKWGDTELEVEYPDLTESPLFYSRLHDPEHKFYLWDNPPIEDGLHIFWKDKSWDCFNGYAEGMDAEDIKKYLAFATANTNAKRDQTA